MSNRLTLWAPRGLSPVTASALAPRFIRPVLKPGQQADVLWVGLRDYIGPLTLSFCRRIVATPTTGLTHIDIEECHRRGIRTLSLQGSDLRDVWATAEHTIGLILALMRRIPAACQHVRAGKWDRSKFQGWEIRGKRALVIGGNGRVGSQVRGFLAGFGAKVVVSESDADTKHALKMLRPNIVTLHENYEPSKRGKYSHPFFSKFKGAMFINTARGEFVDEGALLAAMDAGKVAGAAVDVVADEYKQTRLLADYSKSNPNLIVTPHIAGFTRESVAKTEAMLVKKLMEVEL